MCKKSEVRKQKATPDCLEHCGNEVISTKEGMRAMGLLNVLAIWMRASVGTAWGRPRCAGARTRRTRRSGVHTSGNCSGHGDLT